MIAHALNIIANELVKNLAEYGAAAATQGELGNLPEGFKSGAGGGGVNRDVLNFPLSISRKKRP